jgi:hypothetical protein
MCNFQPFAVSFLKEKAYLTSFGNGVVRAFSRQNRQLKLTSVREDAVHFQESCGLDFYQGRALSTDFMLNLYLIEQKI